MKKTEVKHHGNWWLPGLVVAALVVKSVVLVQLGNHPLLQPHGELDTAYYVDLAKKVAHAGPMAVAEPFFVSPLYVFFLALVFSLTGDSLMAARVVQILLGTAAVALVYLTARQWFGERAARIASLLAALTGFITFSEILLLQTALDPFLTACALYLISRAQHDNRPRYLIAAGVASGLLALNRPNALAYAVVAAALIAWAGYRRPGRRDSPARAAAGRVLIYLAGVFLTLVPNLLRNYAVSGEAILISAHGGLNFFMGNHAGADGTYQRLEGITPSIAGQARDAKSLAEAATGRPMSTGEVSDHFYLLAMDWISEHPADAIALFARKVAILVNRANVALNYSYAFYNRESAVLRVLVVGPWLLFPLGIIGLPLAARRCRAPGYWVWASFIPVYGLSVALFFVSDRYRLPLLLPLCITSTAAMEWMIERLRSRRPMPIIVAVLVFALAFTATSWSLGLNDGFDDERTLKAVALVEQGSYEEARQYMQEIESSHAHPGMMRFQAGLAFSAAGKNEDAIREYRRALEFDPDQNRILMSLGQALAAVQRPAEAIEPLAKAYDGGYERKLSGPLLVWALASTGKKEAAVERLAAIPDGIVDQAETALYFSTVAYDGQSLSQAERWARIATVLAPDMAAAQLRLGTTLLFLNRAKDAVIPLQDAVRLDPQSAEAHRNLALALAGSGQFDEARAQGEEALRLDPSDRKMRAFLNALPPKRR